MKENVHIIAHRGYSGKFPENTLLAYQAAYAYGARWMECDIQLTKDLTAVVHHDENLHRMADVDLDIREIEFEQLKQYSAYYPDRFSDQYIGNPFTSLRQLASWLANHPTVNMFVEIKQHSIDSFGLETCMRSIHEEIKTINDQCIIISFNPEIVALSKVNYGFNNGWVIPEWTDAVKRQADEMQPNFLFSNKNIMPHDPAQWWQGKWHWANYNVDEVTELPKWIEKGLKYIETNEIADLLKVDNIEKFQYKE